MKVGEYYYTPRGRDFRIYCCVYSENGRTASDPVYEEPLFRDKEEARKRVYELNGWKYKPKDN